MRAGDAAAAAAWRGLRALRDPFLQEVQELTQLAELRGALRSGAPGSREGAACPRRPLSATTPNPPLPASVALHPRLHPNCPQPSSLFPDFDHVPQSRPSGAPPSRSRPAGASPMGRPHLLSVRSPTSSPGGLLLQQRLAGQHAVPIAHLTPVPCPQPYHLSLGYFRFLLARWAEASPKINNPSGKLAPPLKPSNKASVPSVSA